jgi:TPR repeat protein
MIGASDRDGRAGKVARRKQGTRAQREAMMARLEMLDAATGALGEAPATADTFFALGMMHASGRSVPTDLVTAHKWFNLAAMKGSAEAVRLRREIATEMTDAEIGRAQRAARDWLKAHGEKGGAPARRLCEAA